MRVLLKTTNSRLTHNGVQSENIQAIKNWIDGTGRLKKQEYLLTNTKTGLSKLTMLYEIDPSIKIESPIR